MCESESILLLWEDVISCFDSYKPPARFQMV